MARRKIKFSADSYYHIFNRGNRKHLVFFEDENYKFFLRQLHKYFDPEGVETVAYFLMPSHFHLVVHLTRETEFSDLMRRFSISFVRSINRWINSVGHGFQGNFGAQLVDTPEYLSHLFRYVHLNPVVARLARSPGEWRFSDSSIWENPDAPGDIPAIRVRNQYFGGASNYKRFVLEYWQEVEAAKQPFEASDA